MGHIDCQPAVVRASKFFNATVEFLRARHYGQNRADVLPNLEKFFNQPDADLKSMLAEASESPPQTDINQI